MASWRAWIVGILVTAGCDQEPSRDVRPFRPGIIFDPALTTPGATVGTLMLDSIDAQMAFDSTHVGSAFFRGEIEVSGATMRHPDADFAHLTCFEADSISSAHLPRWKGDERRPWFCFTNNAEAVAALGASSDGMPATIVVDEYTIHRNFSDSVNSARFIKLRSRGQST